MAEQIDGSSPDTAGEVELVAAERVIFFSDAVVAIAITLLALGLPLPKGSSNTAVWHSLLAGRDAYIAFLISFAVIGEQRVPDSRVARTLRQR
jgi:uncharacterized membrane protein